MTKGLPIFTLAKDVISGWFPISKSNNNELIPYIGKSEELFLYYCEFHPSVLHIERCDIDDNFVKVHKMKKDVLTPIIIPYEFNGKQRNYYPDFIITLSGGNIVIAELGLEPAKMTAESLAKAKSAIDYCNEKGWVYWLITSKNILSDHMENNLKLLRSYDKGMYRDEALSKDIMKIIHKSKNGVTIDYISRSLSNKKSKNYIDMAIYEFIVQAAKQGRLDFDLQNNKLNRNSLINIIPKGNPTIISLPKIHLSYEQIYELSLNPIEFEYNSLIESPKKSRIIYDVEALSEENQEEFYNRLTAVKEILSSERKDSVEKIATKYGYKRSTLRSIVNRYHQSSEKNLLGYEFYNSKVTNINIDLQNFITKLVKQHPDWKITHIHESVELKNAIIKLSKNMDTLVPKPSYQSLNRFIKKIKQSEKDYATDILTLEQRKNGNVKKLSDPGSYVRSIECQLDQVQTDAQRLDIKIVNETRDQIAGKLWAIVLVDVKTNNILGFSLSLKAPMEEDYMMALKCCIEPKDKIVSDFECINNWPCYGIPRVILGDNGKIFTSKRATDVVVRRLKIVEEDAPTYAPSAKGTVESIFKWVVEKLTSRLPGFTKGCDSKEVEKEALKAGITFEDFEKLFVNAIVDSWNIDWDNTRKNSRQILWENAVRENLTNPTWLLDKDELKLLLMKEEQKRKVDRHGISFRDRYYQNKTMIKDIINKRVNIRYDKRDISVIYVYLEDGAYYCEVYCSELLGRRLSIWEDEISKKESNQQKIYHKSTANFNLNNYIVSTSKNIKRYKKPERTTQFEEQIRQYDKADIHTEKVNDVLEQVHYNTSDIKDIENNTTNLKPVNLGNVVLKRSNLRRL